MVELGDNQKKKKEEGNLRIMKAQHFLESLSMSICVSVCISAAV